MCNARGIEKEKNNRRVVVDAPNALYKNICMFRYSECHVNNFHLNNNNILPLGVYLKLPSETASCICLHPVSTVYTCLPIHTVADISHPVS